MLPTWLSISLASSLLSLFTPSFASSSQSFVEFFVLPVSHRRKDYINYCYEEELGITITGLLLSIDFLIGFLIGFLIDFFINFLIGFR